MPPEKGQSSHPGRRDREYPLLAKTFESERSRDDDSNVEEAGVSPAPKPTFSITAEGVGAGPFATYPFTTKEVNDKTGNRIRAARRRKPEKTESAPGHVVWAYYSLVAALDTRALSGAASSPMAGDPPSGSSYNQTVSPSRGSDDANRPQLMRGWNREVATWHEKTNF